jgi:hypothetical protein
MGPQLILFSLHLPSASGEGDGCALGALIVSFFDAVAS